MIFENLRHGQTLTMRDGQFNYEVCYISEEARQVCIEDWATDKLFVLEADGPMLPHLKVIGT